MGGLIEDQREEKDSAPANLSSLAERDARGSYRTVTLSRTRTWCLAVWEISSGLAGWVKNFPCTGAD